MNNRLLRLQDGCAASNHSLDQDLASILREARDFHGHFGPFLVMGVRAGMIAVRELQTDKENKGLRAVASLIYSVPYSCILDGVQFSTGCTVGNKRLRLEESSDFSIVLEDPGNGKVTVALLSKAVDELKRKLAKDLSTEDVERLAHKVASMAEEELFLVDR